MTDISHPSASFERIFPGAGGYVVSGRLDYGADAWLKFDDCTLDIMAAALRSYSGTIPAICHAASATPAVERFLRACGHAFPGAAITYANSADYFAALSACGAERRKIINNHVPCGAHLRADAYAVAPELQVALNDKSRLAALAPEAFVPRREQVPAGRLRAAGFDGPLVIKPVTRYPTGGGCGIFICRTEEDFAAAKRRLEGVLSALHGFVFEELLELTSSWCAQVAIAGDGVHYLGATRQNSASDGRYLGNYHGTGFEAPPGFEDLAMDIGERARMLGYRGFAGFDIGTTTRRETFVFDLNFRVNGSLTQLLFDRRIRSGSGVSKTFRVQTEAGFGRLADMLTPHVEAGRFFPVAGIDGSAHENGISKISGYLCAPTQEEVDNLESELNRELTVRESSVPGSAATPKKTTRAA